MMESQVIDCIFKAAEYLRIPNRADIMKREPPGAFRSLKKLLLLSDAELHAS